eukprot:2928800-Rhodomonas_salina.3
MAQAYDVPASKVALFAVTMQLLRPDACLSDDELRTSLAITVNEYLGTTASAFHTAQVISLSRNMGGEVCETVEVTRRRQGKSQGRRLLQELSSATASIGMLVVFKEGAKASFNDESFGAMPGVLTVVQDAGNTGVTLDSSFHAGGSLEDSGPGGSVAGIRTKNFIIIVAAAVGGLLLCAGGLALVLVTLRRQAAAQEEEELQSVLVFVAQGKTQLQAECEEDFCPPNTRKPDADLFPREESNSNQTVRVRFQTDGAMPISYPAQELQPAFKHPPNEVPTAPEPRVTRRYSATQILHHLSNLPSLPSLPSRSESLAMGSSGLPRPPTAPPPRAPPRPSLRQADGAVPVWGAPADSLPPLPEPVAHYDCRDPPFEQPEPERLEPENNSLLRTVVAFWEWMQAGSNATTREAARA